MTTEELAAELVGRLVKDAERDLSRCRVGLSMAFDAESAARAVDGIVLQRLAAFVARRHYVDGGPRDDPAAGSTNDQMGE